MDTIQVQRIDELPTTPCGLSIGSPSQRLFDSESDNESDNIQRYGTCNGYASQPGSKSNLLLCIQCDLESRSCPYRPRTPKEFGRFIEEDRALRCEQCFIDNNLPLDDCHCKNCNLITTHNERDLICFRCENDSEDRTTEDEANVHCSKCDEPSTTEESPGQTNGSASGHGTSSSNSDNGHYPVDAVVKIHVNDKLFDGDSDDTCDDSSVPSREADDVVNNRLSPIVEQEVQSENAEDSAGSNGGKMNGLRNRYLDGMLVLFM